MKQANAAYTPYNIYIPSQIKNTEDILTGVLVASSEYDEEAHSRALRSVQPNNLGATSDYIIDTKNIPQGVNNKFIN